MDGHVPSLMGSGVVMKIFKSIWGKHKNLGNAIFFFFFGRRRVNRNYLSREGGGARPFKCSHLYSPHGQTGLPFYLWASVAQDNVLMRREMFAPLNKAATYKKYGQAGRFVVT